MPHVLVGIVIVTEAHTGAQLPYAAPVVAGHDQRLAVLEGLGAEHGHLHLLVHVVLELFHERVVLLVLARASGKASATRTVRTGNTYQAMAVDAHNVVKVGLQTGLLAGGRTLQHQHVVAHLGPARVVVLRRASDEGRGRSEHRARFYGRYLWFAPMISKVTGPLLRHMAHFSFGS